MFTDGYVFRAYSTLDGFFQVISVVGGTIVGTLNTVNDLALGVSPDTVFQGLWAATVNGAVAIAYLRVYDESLNSIRNLEWFTTNLTPQGTVYYDIPERVFSDKLTKSGALVCVAPDEPLVRYTVLEKIDDTFVMPVVAAIAVDAATDVVYVYTSQNGIVQAYDGVALISVTGGSVSRRTNNYSISFGTSLMLSAPDIYGTLMEIRLFAPSPNFDAFLAWKTPDMDLFLCSNGDLVLTDAAQKILVASGTNDGTQKTTLQFSAGEYTVVTGDGPFISPSGNYRFEASRLYQNLANLPVLDTYCSDTDALQTACLKSYETYCDTHDDPRCFCFDRQAMLDTLFQPAVLNGNTQLYNQLYQVIGCLLEPCQPYFSEASLAGSYLRETYGECATNVVICSNVVTLDEKSLLTGNLVQTVDCGASTTISCEGICPIGTACDTNTDLCMEVCQSDDNCVSNQKCQGGFCVLKTQNTVPATQESGPSAVEYAMAALLCGVLIALLAWVAVKFK